MDKRKHLNIDRRPFGIIFQEVFRKSVVEMEERQYFYANAFIRLHFGEESLLRKEVYYQLEFNLE